MTKSEDLSNLGGGFIQSGTGAVQRTVESKLKDIVSVKDFGAVGDGVADDAVAINRAVRYVADQGGGTVYYPSGTYRITRAIRMENYDIETCTYYNNQPRRNIFHQGAGRDTTKIVADNFYCSIFTSFPEPFVTLPQYLAYIPQPSFPAPGWDVREYTNINCVIADMTLDGGNLTQPDGGTVYGINYQGWVGAGNVWPNGSTSQSTFASDNYQYPIYTFRTYGVQIRDCRIQNGWYNGVEVYTSDEVLIQNNIIEDCSGVGKANIYGHYSGIQLDNATTKVVITGNEIIRCGNGIMSNGDPLSYALSAVQDVVVSNNIIDTTVNSGMYIFNWIDRWLVANNILRNIGGSGLNFANPNPAGSTVSGEIVQPGRHPQNCTISNNTIYEYNLNNGVSALAIRGQGQTFTISGNSIYQYSNSVTADTAGIVIQDGGVVITTGSQSGLVSNNKLVGKFPASSQTVGIVQVATNNTLCEGNVIQSTASAAYCAIRSSSNGCSIRDNHVLGTYLYNSGNRQIFYAGGTGFLMQDGRNQPQVRVITTVGRGGIGPGWVNVDFSGYGPTLVDTRGNFAANIFTADVPGLYLVRAQSQFNSAGSTASPELVRTAIEKNGASQIALSVGYSLGQLTLAIETVVQLAAGETLRLQMNSSSTSFTQESGTSFSAQLLDYN